MCCIDRQKSATIFLDQLVWTSEWRIFSRGLGPALFSLLKGKGRSHKWHKEEEVRTGAYTLPIYGKGKMGAHMAVYIINSVQGAGLWASAVPGTYKGFEE